MNDFYSKNSGITNNNIDTYQTYKSISQNNQNNNMN